jgi:sigma-E factor negative regulatory protein RseA
MKSVGKSGQVAASDHTGMQGGKMMDKQIRAERLSSLLDGELDEKELDALLLELNDEETLTTWDQYQQIGSALRGEAPIAMRPDFAARVAAQLAAEPTYQADVATAVAAAVAPAVAVAPAAAPSNKFGFAQQLNKKWLAIAAAAGAAFTALTMVGAPQLMVALNGPLQPNLNTNANVQLAANKPVTLLASSGSQAGTSSEVAKPGAEALNPALGQSVLFPSAQTGIANVSGPAASIEMTQRLLKDGKPVELVYLRDPLIDQYLLAHQRFSPSVYSTAQYARSAAFANEKDK